MYEELAPKSIYSKLKGYIEDLPMYFPDYEDTPDFVPAKRFMWDIFATKDYELASRFVDHAMMKRHKNEDDKHKTIELDEGIYRELMESNFFSKKKGKAITMMACENINKKIKRKRKREFGLFEPKDHFRGKRNRREEDKDDENTRRHVNPFLDLDKLNQRRTNSVREYDEAMSDIYKEERENMQELFEQQQRNKNNDNSQ